MSGILGHFAVPGGTVDRRTYARGFAALSHHGRHGRALVEGSSWMLGRQIGERDPGAVTGNDEPRALLAGQGAIWVAHDGHLDNRAELCRRLGLPAATTPDARLLVRAYEAWGEGMFEHLVGPLALVVVDGRRKRVMAGRDALGDRLLVWAQAPDGGLVVASEEPALLASAFVSDAPDDVALAHFLAVRPLPPGRTFFRDVNALPAGHYLTWDGGAVTVARHWNPPVWLAGDPRSPGEWVDEARVRFREAVSCRMPDPERAAVLMSGGLDSTAIAVEAAEILAEARGVPPSESGLHTISWIFDEMPAADERRWIEATTGALGLRSSRIVADGAWPLSGDAPWPIAPALPAQTVYRRLLESSYARAREAGTPVLLSGDFADQLYVGSQAWLRELLDARRWGTAVVCATWEALSPRGRGLGLRAALGRAFRPAGRPAAPPPWLTEGAAGLLEPPPELPPALRPEQLAAVTAGWAIPYENPVAARAAVELRRPYRDRRLVELFLRMPALALHRPGWPKWLTRQMTKGRLPELVRRRRRGTTMLPLAQRGLAERELPVVRAWLGRPDALWPAFVRRDWLEASFPADLAAGHDGAASLVPWSCLCLEMWSARREAGEVAA